MIVCKDVGRVESFLGNT